MAEDSLVGKWRFKGKLYELHQSDLTISRMRAIGDMFGERYASFAGFIALVLQTDVNALACALWIMQQKEGENPPHPNEMDFSLADFESVETPKRAKRPGNPTRTPGSAKTSGSSEGSISSA